MNPSLLLIPDRYKASKLYSQIPDSGAGDLAFTRALDTATRVNSEGLIEKVRTNLFEQSQTFENAYWALGNTTITTNATTAPDGTLTAEKLTATTTGTDRRIQKFASLSAGIYTNSIFVKASELNIIRMYGADFSGQATFTLTGSGIVAGVLGGATATIASLPNGWYRCSVSVSFAGGSTQSLYLNIGDALGGATINAGDGVFIWGAQLETGDIATPYIPTTTAAVSVGPVANIPRIDYTGGGCGKLLLEPQRTNVIQYSEQFNNAAWTPTGLSVVANNAISPDGNQNADTLTFGADSSQNIYNFPTSTIGAHVFSVYAKTASGTKQFRLRIDTGSGPAVSSNFTATTTWQRFEFALTTTATNTVAYIFNDSVGVAGSLQVWGCQFEAGSYVSSYIPTLGAQVTRSADAASKTGISSLIGQSEGSIYWEGSINTLGDFPQICDLNADGDKFIQIYLTLVGGTPRLALYVQNVSVLLNASNIATLTYDTNFKFALGYKNNDYAVYLNGAQVYVNTTIGVPPTANFGIAKAEQTAEGSGKKVNAAALYNTRLSNSELASLTSL